ncbi:MAG: efflux RND transporter periplasmic adaptor subunit [Chloroflexota bacterium]
MKKAKTPKKTFWIVLSIIAVSLLGAYFAAQTTNQSDQSTAEAQISRAREGDIQITVSGSGELIAQDEIDLSFSMSGVIETLAVQIGDRVQAGDMLAALDSDQAELSLLEAELAWEQVNSPAAIAEAEAALSQAEVSLEEVQKELLILNAGPYIPTYQTRYDLAFEAYQEALAKMRAAKRPRPFARAVEQTEEAVDAALEALIWAQTYTAPEEDLTRLTLEVDLARAYLRDQGTLVAMLHGTPLPEIEDSAIGPAVIALQNAAISLQTAGDALAKTELAAPIDGTVSALFVDENESITSGSPVLTLTTVDQLLLHFYLEESDIAWVSIGDPIQVHLSAYPDVIIDGSISSINPVMVNVDRSWMVELWAEINLPSNLELLPGISAEVEVIAAETVDAVLVPTQALIEGADGSYQIAVILDNEQVEYRQVSVGLRDFANAEILSGLAVGEKISTTPDLLPERSQ